MTNHDPQPDFSDPEFINEFFSSHPDFSPESKNRMEFIPEVEEYAVQLAIKEAQVFAYLKPHLSGIDELQQLVLSKDAEAPTLPDLIAELAVSRNAIIEDSELTDAERHEILDKLAYTLEIASSISDIAAKLLYPEIESTVADIKQCIENGDYLSDIEKAVLTHACDYLLMDE